jgi:autotransporter translocation and assembly factor TamB
MNELRTDERVNLAARAGALAASAIATPIADSVARALDLDVFEIRPSSEITAGGSITIGRQLNDNLFVGFQQQFGAGEMSKLTFEYRLTEFLRLVTAFAQGTGDRKATIARAEAAGIDLVFVIRR